MNRYSQYFAYILIVLFLTACGDGGVGGRDEPIEEETSSGIGSSVG